MKNLLTWHVTVHLSQHLDGDCDLCKASTTAAVAVTVRRSIFFACRRRSVSLSLVIANNLLRWRQHALWSLLHAHILNNVYNSLFIFTTYISRGLFSKVLYEHSRARCSGMTDIDTHLSKNAYWLYLWIWSPKLYFSENWHKAGVFQSFKLTEERTVKVEVNLNKYSCGRPAKW